MSLRKLEKLTVCMWCFRIRRGGRLCSIAGRLHENRLHSVIRCLAVCTARSGQLQVGEDIFFILWRYDGNLPLFVRNCVRVKFGHTERDSLAIFHPHAIPNKSWQFPIISLTCLFGLLNTPTVTQTVDSVSQNANSFSDRRLYFKS